MILFPVLQQEGRLFRGPSHVWMDCAADRTPPEVQMGRHRNQTNAGCMILD